MTSTLTSAVAAPSEDLLVRMRQQLPSLRPSERRLAQAALAKPSMVSAMSITAFAAQAGTSPATAVRFCKTMGYDGYRAFCLALARAAADESGRRIEFGVADGDIGPDDTTGEAVRKLAFQEARAIEETAAMVALDEVDRVVARILNAPVIDLFGSAGSGLAAQDLQQKLRRIGYQANAWTDAHLALTSAAVLPENAVAVAFSHSGETEEALSTIETAAASGAFTVAVTNFPESPLAQIADAVLVTASRETRFRYGAMSSRMAQLVIVDIIFMSVAQRRPDSVADALAATFSAVQGRRRSRPTHIP